MNTKTWLFHSCNESSNVYNRITTLFENKTKTDDKWNVIVSRAYLIKHSIEHIPKIIFVKILSERNRVLINPSLDGVNIKTYAKDFVVILRKLTRNNPSYQCISIVWQNSSNSFYRYWAETKFWKFRGQSRPIKGHNFITNSRKSQPRSCQYRCICKMWSVPLIRSQDFERKWIVRTESRHYGMTDNLKTVYPTPYFVCVGIISSVECIDGNVPVCVTLDSIRLECERRGNGR